MMERGGETHSQSHSAIFGIDTTMLVGEIHSILSGLGLEEMQRQIHPYTLRGTQELRNLDASEADILSGQLGTLDEIMGQVSRFDWEKHTKDGKQIAFSEFQKNTLFQLLEQEMIPEPDMREILACFYPNMGAQITSTWYVHRVKAQLKTALRQ